MSAPLDLAALQSVLMPFGPSRLLPQAAYTGTKFSDWSLKDLQKYAESRKKTFTWRDHRLGGFGDISSAFLELMPDPVLDRAQEEAIRNPDVNMPAVDQTKYNDQTSLRTLIRRERRVELALEGLRWYDIQRWQIGDQVMNGQVAVGNLRA